MAAVAACREAGAPVLSRGGGTSLEVLTYGGLRTWTGETSDEESAAILAADGERAALYRRLREIRDACLGEIRTGYPKIPRPAPITPATAEGSPTEVDVLDSGCCALAGNFGFERRHYEVSVACAEHRLWPAVRDARPETAVLADGFSCRTQIQAGRLGPRGNPPR